MINPSASFAALNDLAALLKLLSDPRKTAEAVAAIQGATKQYAELQQQSQGAAAKAAEDRKAAQAIAEANQKALAQLDNFSADLDRREAALIAQAVELSKRADEIVIKESSLKSTQEAHNAGVAAQTKALKDREYDLDAREKAVAGREARAEALVKQHSELIERVRGAVNG